jgi:hypothetical protein
MTVSLQFDEILLDPDLFNLGFATGGPEFANNNMRSPITGVTRVAVLRYDPQIIWAVDFQDISHPDPKGLEYFNNIWYGGFGSAYGMRVRVETDHSVIDESIGTGNASATVFKLTKTYNRPGTSGHSYIRRIIKPVVSTHLGGGSVTLYQSDGSTARVIEVPFKIYLDGSNQTSGWTVDNTTGIVTFSSPPGNGIDISWDGQFDTPMQFWTNSFQQKADFPAEIKGLQMIEIMPASLGIT